MSTVLGFAKSIGSRYVSIVVAVTMLGFGAAAFTSCTSARNALGTNSSPCYLALPVAENAVHHRGIFGGVRLVTAKDLASHVHFLDELTDRAGGKLKDVCVVEYLGSYRIDEVENPLGRTPPGGVGRYAIVVVSRTSNRLLATLVRATLPVRFRHVA